MKLSYRSAKDQGHTIDTQRYGALTLSPDKGAIKPAVREEQFRGLNSQTQALRKMILSGTHNHNN